MSELSRKEGIFDLAADAQSEVFTEPAEAMQSPAKLEEELARVREKEYFRFLGRLQLGQYSGRLTPEQADDFRRRLREICAREFDESRAERLFGHERPSSKFLELVISEIEYIGIEVEEPDLWENYEIHNGELFGRVRIGTDTWLPVVGNEIVGRVPIPGSSEEPTLIYSIGRAFFPDGQLTAHAEVASSLGRIKQPIWQGALQEKIEGRFIFDSEVSDATLAGWSGWVRLMNNRDAEQVPVHNGRLRPTVPGHPEQTVERCQMIHDHRGKMSGLVRHSRDFRILAVIDDELMEEIGLYKQYSINNTESITFQESDGREVWNGTVEVLDPEEQDVDRRWKVKAVVGSEIVASIDGIEINGARNISVDPRGRPSGMVGVLKKPEFNDLRWLPLVDGRIQTTIEGVPIETCRATDVRDGTWSGWVTLKTEGEPTYPVYRGRLVRSWQGQSIDDISYSRLFEIDGTINGILKYRVDGSERTYHLCLDQPPGEVEDSRQAQPVEDTGVAL